MGTRPSPDGSPTNVLRHVYMRFDAAPISTLPPVLPQVHFADVRCNCHCPRHCVLQGSDQIRQAFSKRKKGLVLKAFQLNSLTDAKVSTVDWLCRSGSPAEAAGTAGTTSDFGHRRPCSCYVCGSVVLLGEVSAAVAASSAVQRHQLQQSHPCCLMHCEPRALFVTFTQQRIAGHELHVCTPSVVVYLHPAFLLPAPSPCSSHDAVGSCWLSCSSLQVFMFIVNDKGTSWAYATPGFANSLNQTVLKQLRGLADVPEQAKLFTEVCTHSSCLMQATAGLC